MRSPFFLSIVLLLAAFPRAGGADPVPLGSTLIDPADRGVGANETIRILTRWNGPGYRITADFSALDLGEGGSPVVEDQGDNSYVVVYSTGGMASLPDSAGLVIPITAFDPISDSSFVDSDLRICRRARSLPPEHVATAIRDGQLVFHSADSLIVTTTWRTHGSPGFRVAADYRSLVPDFRETEVRVEALGAGGQGVETYRLSYKIPGKIRVGQERDGILLEIFARDDLCSRIAAPELLIDLREGQGPGSIDHRVVQPEGRGVRDGDTVVIWSRWDAGGYTLRPDFTGLDRGAGGLASVIDSSVVDTAAAGSYVIRYTPGPMADLPDAAVAVPITAIDDFGDTFTEGTLQICRNHRTPGPVSLGSTVLGQRTRFKLRDSLQVLTRWTSPSGLPITVEADYRELAPGFDAGDAAVHEIGPDSFLVQYRIPAEGLAADRNGIRLRLRATDTLCSVAVDDGITIDLDTHAPAEIPTVDPLPEETNQPELLVRGSAPGCARVNVVLNGIADSASVDDADRFLRVVFLRPGENRINVSGLDDIGNSTPSSPTQIVNYVAEQSTVYPTPLRPGDEILVHDSSGLRAASIWIYNLEGDLLFRHEAGAPGFEARFVWDGRDRQGDLARPGYYLMRVRRTTTRGQDLEEVLPLLLRDE